MAFFLAIPMRQPLEIKNPADLLFFEIIRTSLSSGVTETILWQMNTTKTQPHYANTSYSNIKEESARLGISQRLLWRWIKSRRVPSFKIGRRVLLISAEVDEALRGFRTAHVGEI